MQKRVYSPENIQKILMRVTIITEAMFLHRTKTQDAFTPAFALCHHVFTATMGTPSNGKLFRATGPLWGNHRSSVVSPSQRPATMSFNVFFNLCLKKRLNKQSRRRWLESPSRSLWRHCNVIDDSVLNDSNLIVLAMESVQSCTAIDIIVVFLSKTLNYLWIMKTLAWLSERHRESIKRKNKIYWVKMIFNSAESSLKYNTE